MVTSKNFIDVIPEGGQNSLQLITASCYLKSVDGVLLVANTLNC